MRNAWFRLDYVVPHYILPARFTFPQVRRSLDSGQAPILWFFQPRETTLKIDEEPCHTLHQLFSKDQGATSQVSVRFMPVAMKQHASVSRSWSANVDWVHCNSCVRISMFLMSKAPSCAPYNKAFSSALQFTLCSCCHSSSLCIAMHCCQEQAPDS